MVIDPDPGGPPQLWDEKLVVTIDPSGAIIEQMVPLTPAEIAVATADRAAAKAEADAQATADAARAALIAKLDAGTATEQEIQAALAELLGGQ